MNLHISPDQHEDQNNYLRDKIMSLPSALPTLFISEHAEKYRVLPPGTPRPGKLDLSYTPYLIEPMNNMSPFSPIQHTIIMKGAQIGFTMLGECVVCYYMGYAPADQLFISATEDLLERWATRRLEPAIDSYDLRKHIYAQYVGSERSRRTGDKTLSKEYFGCRLDMASAQSAPKLRSTDKRILIRDEIDGAPSMLTTGEGNWLDVSYARTNAWAERRKILDFSTPTTYELSNVFPAYESGDMNHYYVKCPNCYEYQTIEFERIKPILRDGLIYDSYMECVNPKCGFHIKNHHKSYMYDLKNNHPHYRATSKSDNPYKKSYWVPSLYAPVGMIGWTEILQLHERAKSLPDGMRSFVNLYLGLPFREEGTRPKAENVIHLRGGYLRGTVPDGVLYLTIGVDVQRGSEKDTSNPPRIEMEVLGHGADYRTYSVNYLTFYGDTSDPHSGAWKEFSDYAVETGLIFKRSDGYEFSPEIIFIDSGDGLRTDVVYEFCAGWERVYPCKGFHEGMMKRKSGEKQDGSENLQRSRFHRYRYIKISETLVLYEINKTHYTMQLYRNLKKERVAGEQLPGFCDFPRDYDQSYFAGLVAGEVRQDGSVNKGGRRAEPLDCRVYAQCAGELYLNMLVDDFKAYYKNEGYNPQQLTDINHKFVQEFLKKKTARIQK